MAENSRPKRQRTYGQGMITEQRPGVYRLRIFAGRHPVTGKPIQRTKLFTGTHAAAERAMTELRLQVERERSTPVGLTTMKATLGEVVDAHLTASRGRLAAGTMAAYDSTRKLHLPEVLLKRRIESLTAQSFRDLYAWLEGRGLSDSSIWKVYALLSGALTRAIREHGVAFDSKQMVTPRKPAAAKRQMAGDEELSRVFAEARLLGEEWPLLFRLACATGMRRGELVGLRWESLDASGVLYVDAGIVAVKGRLLATSTKTGEARSVQLDRGTVAAWNTTSRLHIDKGRRDAGNHARRPEFDRPSVHPEIGTGPNGRAVRPGIAERRCGTGAHALLVAATGAVVVNLWLAARSPDRRRFGVNSILETGHPGDRRDDDAHGLLERDGPDPRSPCRHQRRAIRLTQACRVKA